VGRGLKDTGRGPWRAKRAIAEIAGIARDREGKTQPGSPRIREAAIIEQWSGSFYSLFRELRLLE